ncbi:MAG: penicillin acylase family protein [Marinobacter sp.]|uniref:penicillin acylase family protein n=1 Tax=Marinobacter sp. TaxID=50741 RepID=UPI0034A06960
MNNSINLSRRIKPRLSNARVLGVALAGSLLLTGCFDGDGDSSGSESDLNTQLFPADGRLEATIRRTTNGVPHVRAENLKSAAFGAGYAQAQDNICLLAEAFVKARSERAKYFGPGPDDINIVTDFSYKAQEIRSGAAADFTSLTDESRALMEGFTDGYNKYVAETDPAVLPAECRSQPWVFEISPIDLYAYYRIVGQYASGALFADGLVFAAVPPGAPVVPSQAVAANGVDSQFDGSQIADNARQMAAERTNYTDIGLGSNAWGVGKDMTEQGSGALLANPHFPYTGHRRLYQMQMTVPGYLNVNGAGLLGTAIPFVNFNENLAWSHTVTTSRQFTWYELELKPGDNMVYIKDGVEKPIIEKTLQIEVNVGAPQPMVLERSFYFSEYGPMLAANEANAAFPEWGENGLVNQKPAAYTYRDANASSERLLDSWLQMSQASNLEEFKDVFRNCGTTFWTNSVYADDQGNAYYIDSSSVPNLSPAAIAVLNFKRVASPEFDQLYQQGVTLLDGSKSRDDWVPGECENGLVPFEGKPKLQRADWVQNSNDSYWATNPAELLAGYSPMFGTEKTPLNPRTRLSLSMLLNPLDSGPVSPNASAPGGQDGKFSAIDLINVIYNNRGWYADQFLAELQERCAAIGDAEVNLPASGNRSVSEGCSVLQDWDGVYNTDSVGAHVFRVFIANYRKSFETDLTVRFNASAPVATPSTPSSTNEGEAGDLMLQALAVGLNALDTGGIAYNAKLGDVQYYQPSGGVPPGGVAMEQADPIPWPGGDGGVIEGIGGGADGGIDGTFNSIGVFTGDVAEDTRFPRIAPAIIENTAGLSQNGDGWIVARGTSFHFGLEFTDNGPVAFGLMSYSQSTDEDSPHFIDQSLRYSEENYRQLWFAESDIEANLLSQGETTITN